MKSIISDTGLVEPKKKPKYPYIGIIKHTYAMDDRERTVLFTKEKCGVILKSNDLGATGTYVTCWDESQFDFLTTDKSVVISN